MASTISTLTTRTTISSRHVFFTWALVILPLLFSTPVLSSTVQTGTYVTISNVERGVDFVLFGQGITDKAYVTITNINSAGAGKEWQFQPVPNASVTSSSDAYFINNKAFPNYRLDVHDHGRPFLGLASDDAITQIWQVETWGDGKFKLWQASATDSSLAASGSGSSTNVTTGNDNLHHWDIQPISSTPNSTAEAESPSSTSKSSSSLSRGAIAGIAVGVNVGVITIVGIIGFFVWRQRRIRQLETASTAPVLGKGEWVATPLSSGIRDSNPPPWQTVPANSHLVYSPSELCGLSSPVELHTPHD